MLIPDLSFEKERWERGKTLVAGADEVGRGSFAGPVVAACVGFSFGVVVPRDIVVADSKLLTHKQRIIAKGWVEQTAEIIGVGEASVGQINKLGVVRATHVAYRECIKNAGNSRSIDHLLVDAFAVPYVAKLPRKKQTPIVKGDQLSLSIAAASIIAKVYRDEQMMSLGLQKQFRKYHWRQNKGYGTRAHRDAISMYGITKHHRVQFVTTFLKKSGKLPLPNN